MSAAAPTRIAVLGTGAMGRPMAENLARAGFEVRAWDPDQARAAEVAGATVLDTPRAAADGAEIVVTMAPDGAAVHETMFGEGGVAEVMPAGTVWLQTSTIGARWARDLAALAAERRILAVDAPVIGSIPVAEAGNLDFFAAASGDVRPRVAPLLDAMGARTFWFDSPGDGQRAKLVVNGWILTLIEATVESLAFADGVGVAPRDFLDILDGQFVGSPLMQSIGRSVLEGDFGGSLRLRLAHKDLGLIIEAAEEAGVDLALAPAARERMQRAIDAGYGDKSASATWFVTRRRGEVS